MTYNGGGIVKDTLALPGHALRTSGEVADNLITGLGNVIGHVGSGFESVLNSVGSTLHKTSKDFKLFHKLFLNKFNCLYYFFKIY